jgi:hypothetical protein
MSKAVHLVSMTVCLPEAAAVQPIAPSAAATCFEDRWPKPVPPTRSDSAQTWLMAPSTLEALLARCDPRDWDGRALGDRARNKGAANAMRLWAAIQYIASQPDAQLNRLEITAPDDAWHWSVWQAPHKRYIEVVSFITLHFASGELDFALCWDPDPVPLRKLHPRRQYWRFDENNRKWCWCIDAPGASMAYAQARAFVAALVLCLSPTVLDLGPRPAWLRHGGAS